MACLQPTGSSPWTSTFKGYRVFYPRWQGWSGGQFLERSPHHEILDILGKLPNRIQELAFGRKFSCSPSEIFVIGGSFGGTATLLFSLDSRIIKVFANCAVVDWAVLRKEEKKKLRTPAYIRAAFGNGFRLSAENWNKYMTAYFSTPHIF